MLNAKQALLILLLGVPAIASAHETRIVTIEKVHYDVHRDRAARNYGGWGDGRINRMQYVQQQRIREGVRSGELTRGEAKRLWNEQARIAQLERRYKSDGHLSVAERHALERDLNRAGRRIYNEKRDGQDRR